MVVALGVQILASASDGYSVDLGSLITPILSTGLVGVFLLMIIFRVKIMPSWIYDEMEKRYKKELENKDAQIDEYRDQVAKLRTLTEEEIIPTLVRSNQLLGEAAQARERELQRARDQEMMRLAVQEREREH